ncbi:hypothetical protein NC651_009953 [Populus alba x Populus x berolinensis]|nr:hypothetical protein NC651_009953 [Populus alba x Populus x berolinensis]
MSFSEWGFKVAAAAAAGGALNNALWILLVYFTYNSKLGRQQIASSRVVGLAKAMML